MLKSFRNNIPGCEVTEWKQLKIWAVASEKISLTGEFIFLHENQSVIQL